MYVLYYTVPVYTKAVDSATTVVLMYVQMEKGDLVATV
jgi:hypothetical protein